MDSAPQLNGVSERRSRILLDMVRSMMGFTELPTYLWGHAFLTEAKILNNVYTKAVQIIPYELWTKNKPSYSYLRIWGCPVYVKHHYPVS